MGFLGPINKSKKGFAVNKKGGSAFAGIDLKGVGEAAIKMVRNIIFLSRRVLRLSQQLDKAYS